MLINMTSILCNIRCAACSNSKILFSKPVLDKLVEILKDLLSLEIFVSILCCVSCDNFSACIYIQQNYKKIHNELNFFIHLYVSLHLYYIYLPNVKILLLILRIILLIYAYIVHNIEIDLTMAS